MPIRARIPSIAGLLVADGVSGSPLGITSNGTLGTPSGSITVSGAPTGITSTGSLGTPSGEAIPNGSPVGITGTGTLGTPSGAIIVTGSPAGITSTGTLGTPSGTSAVNGKPLGITSTGTLGTPDATVTPNATPLGLVSTGTLGRPDGQVVTEQISILAGVLNSGISIIQQIELDDRLTIQHGPTSVGPWTNLSGYIFHASDVSKSRDEEISRDDTMRDARLVAPHGAEIPETSNFVRIGGIVYSIESMAGDTVKTYHCARAEMRSAGADRGVSR